MDDFFKLEEKFKHAPVRLLDHNASGVLRLRGRKSRLEVSSGSLIHIDQLEDNGWYDIRLRSSDGREILLHHAITVGSASHHWSSESDTAHTLTIFPNVVVDDIRGLSNGHRVQKILFRLHGLHNFFHYQHSESLQGYEATFEQIETLRSMRYVPDREDGPFQPRGIYVIHEFPVLLNFRVGDRAYQVWSGGSFSGGSWDRIDARTYPVAEIAFDLPVSIETALDRVWEWRRLFAQMAMVQLPFEAISVRGTLEEQAPSANIYLPNLKRRAPTKGPHSLSARHLALNSWHDREKLGEAMRGWLERDHVRRRFRVGLDHVIERMERRIDPSDLIDLGSAVDSLTELVPAGTLPVGALDSMVSAAHSAARAAGARIDRERLAGLLGALQRPSLAKRFAGLASGISPPMSSNDAELLVRSATRIRHASAHGGAISDQLQPRIAPTIDALTALCVRFDLESCGFSSRSSADARTMSKIRFDEGLEQLRTIPLTPAPPPPAPETPTSPD